MTAPEPLELRDHELDTYLDATVENVPSRGGPLVVLYTQNDETAVPRVALTVQQVRELIRWLTQALGEPAVVGYVRCANCSVLFDPATGHHCPPTHDGLYDDEQVRRWLADDAHVTEVEGQPQ